VQSAAPTTAASPLASGIWPALRSARAARVLSVLGFFGVWQLLVPLLETELLPLPMEVAQFMWEEARAETIAPQTVWQSFGVSLQRLGVGLSIAVLIGLPIGLAMGVSRKVHVFLHDFVVVGLAFPSLVWALITGMWFGPGNTAPLLTVVLAAVTFVIINVEEGVRDVPKELLDMASSYGVARRKAVRHVILPSLMPFFFAALRYAMANGWKGLVIAEVFASTTGAGWMIRYWYEAGDSAGFVGYALYFVLFSLVVERLVFGRLSDRVFRWRPSVLSGMSRNV
jgi:ABC-type nitrate/sulfonate/bicarbonate transport system permease component